MTTVTVRRSAPGHPASPTAPLAGLGALVRLILRRDRVRLPVWIVALVLGTVGSAASLPGVYHTAAERQARGALLHDNPAGIAFSGPGYGLDHYTFGAMMANEMLGFVAILVALMSILCVVRHTRGEEEAGRAELVRAGVVGRWAYPTSVLAVAAGANVVLGLLVAVGLATAGVPTLTWLGSLAFGAAAAGVGLVFAAVAAVLAQLTEHARAASGIAGGLLGLAFVLRAAGDMGNGVASWLSPIGWAQAMRAYVDERWWPLGLALAVAAALSAAAVRLAARRDLGAGLVPQRSGPGRASPLLGTPVGFAVRQQRAGLLWWSVALLAFGAVYGSLINAVGQFVADNATMRDMLSSGSGGSLVDGFLAVIVSMLAMVCALYAVQATLRLRGEETAGRAESLLSTGLSRPRWMGAHVVVALAGSAVVLLLGGLGLGGSAAASTGDLAMLGSIVGAAAAYVPAVWVGIGLAAALIGWLPRIAPVAWVVPAFALVVGFLGRLLRLPESVTELSPFEQVPRMPGAALDVVPLVILAAVAAALIVLGLVGMRRRDLATG